MRWKLLPFVLLVLAVLMSSCSPGYDECVKNEIIYQRGVAALIDDKSSSGIFVFGTGTVNQVTVIRFREVLPDGGNIVREVRGKSTIVYEDSDYPDQGTVIKRAIACRPDYPGSTCHEICGYTPHSVESNTWYELHVPKGTFITDFNLDLQ